MLCAAQRDPITLQADPPRSNGQVPFTRTRQVAANMAASYFDDDFEDLNHDLSGGNDDETMLFLS